VGECRRGKESREGEGEGRRRAGYGEGVNGIERGGRVWKRDGGIRAWRVGREEGERGRGRDSGDVRRGDWKEEEPFPFLRIFYLPCSIPVLRRLRSLITQDFTVSLITPLAFKITVQV